MENKQLNNALTQFLDVDGVTELKSKVIDMIVDEIRTQLHESSNYIISPDDIANELYEDVLKKAKEEIILEYKEKIKEIMSKKLGSILNGLEEV